MNGYFCKIENSNLNKIFELHNEYVFSTYEKLLPPDKKLVGKQTLNQIVDITENSLNYNEDTIKIFIEKVTKHSKINKKTKEFIDYLITNNFVPASFRIENVEKEIEKSFLSLLPEKLKNFEIPQVQMFIVDRTTSDQTQSNRLTIHKDYGRNSTINCYFKTNGEKTILYDALETGIQLYSREHRILTPRIYKPEWVIEKSSFVPESNEIYVLNVSKPHTVININKYSKRIAISYSFKMSYENLMEALQ